MIVKILGSVDSGQVKNRMSSSGSFKYFMGIADIGLNPFNIVQDRFKMGYFAPGKVIQDTDEMALFHEVANQVTANKSGTTCNEHALSIHIQPAFDYR
jgi:hypothetical protein